MFTTKKEVDKHVRTTLVKLRTDNEVFENENLFFFELSVLTSTTRCGVSEFFFLMAK